MAERFKAPVLKTGVGIPPRVRIPLSPLVVVVRRNLFRPSRNSLINQLITKLALKIIVRRQNYETAI
jgi:hypothetical protein